MKKEERMHRLLGEIDDSLVAEATRRPVSKTVWMPVAAAAACVALAVGLWQGGVFAPAQLPVEPPTEGSTTEPTDTDVVTDPTDTTTKEPDADTTTAKPTTTTTTAKPTTTTTTAKPTTTTTAKPTTTTTVKPTTTTTKSEPTKTTAPYILVGGEDDSTSLSEDFYPNYPSLKNRLVSPALEEKMKEYRDVNAVFLVGILGAYTIEDQDEISNFLKTDEEYQSLLKQFYSANEAYEEAKKRFKPYEFRYDDPCREDLQRKVSESSNKVERLREKLGEYRYKLIMNRMEERLSYAAKYSKTKPVSGFGLRGKGYYMQLTADAINELADRGGYEFYLASEEVPVLFAD